MLYRIVSLWYSCLAFYFSALLIVLVFVPNLQCCAVILHVLYVPHSDTSICLF